MSIIPKSIGDRLRALPSITDPQDAEPRYQWNSAATYRWREEERDEAPLPAQFGSAFIALLVQAIDESLETMSLDPVIRNKGAVTSGLLWFSSQAICERNPREILLRIVWSETGAISSMVVRGGVARQVRGVFLNAREEVFEDGMHSQFSRSLIALVNKYGKEALRAISSEMSSSSADVDVVCEALKWLGVMTDKGTAEERLKILGEYLLHGSLRVRDAAFCGIDAMTVREAIPILQEALGEERNPSLRRDVERLLSILATAR